MWGTEGRCPAVALQPLRNTQFLKVRHVPQFCYFSLFTSVRLSLNHPGLNAHFLFWEEQIQVEEMHMRDPGKAVRLDFDHVDDSGFLGKRPGQSIVATW